MRNEEKVVEVEETVQKGVEEVDAVEEQKDEEKSEGEGTELDE